MENYFERLLTEFKLATGEYDIDPESEEFDEKFSSWIKEMDKMGVNFAEFLDSYNLDFKNENAAEFGKGEYDSIVKPFKTSIITDAGESFLDVEEDRLIDGKLFIERNGLYLLEKNDGTFELNNLEIYGIDTLLTHNPFEYKQIDGWEYIHNKGLSKIILGLYGKINDLDKEKKELIIKRFKSYLNEYTERKEINNDEYYYFLTNLKIKRLSKMYRGFNPFYDEVKNSLDKGIPIEIPRKSPNIRVKTRVKTK